MVKLALSFLQLGLEFLIILIFRTLVLTANGNFQDFSPYCKWEFSPQAFEQAGSGP